MAGRIFNYDPIWSETLLPEFGRPTATDRLPKKGLHTMQTHPQSAELTEPIDTRIKMSALWIAMVFVFAYVDIFSLYKPGIIDDIQAGKIYVFDITQTFLFFTTLFIVIPSLMVFFTLVLPPRANRATNTIVPGIYAVVVIGNAVGEWSYYIFGSVVEAVLLAGVIAYARTLGRSGLEIEHASDRLDRS